MTSFSGMDTAGLIAQLQAVHAAHGNIEVRVDGQDWIGAGFAPGEPGEFPDYFDINL